MGWGPDSEQESSLLWVLGQQLSDWDIQNQTVPSLYANKCTLLPVLEQHIIRIISSCPASTHACQLSDRTSIIEIWVRKLTSDLMWQIRMAGRHLDRGFSHGLSFSGVSFWPKFPHKQRNRVMLEFWYLKCLNLWVDISNIQYNWRFPLRGR